MCTLVLAWRVFDDAPIAAAANRDEALDRPARPPRLLDADPAVVAPQDEAAGGTWIGYNDAGVFVAITNRRSDGGVSGTSEREGSPTPRLEGERSRGLLVRDALARESAGDAVAFVRNELAAREYAGFNLVVADAAGERPTEPRTASDAGEAALLEWDGVLRTTHFDPGVHVVVNDGYNDAAPKAARVREAIRPDPGDDAPAWFERAKGVLRDHDLGTCVHGDGYGTRSSSLIAVDSAGEGRYWFADGRPCETDYEAVEVDGI